MTFDFSPIDDYLQFILPVLRSLALILKSADYGCVNNRYPNGRVLSIIANPINAASLLAAMGPNGFFILSGYDLYYGEKSQSPAEYAASLTTRVDALINAVTNTSYKFSISVPASASTREFSSSFDTLTGLTTVNSFKIFDNGSGYLEAAIGVIKSSMSRFNSSCVGTTLWGVSDKIFDGNLTFSPNNPFESRGEAFWLSSNLPSYNTSLTLS